MISTRDIDAIIGAEAVDQDNDRIGKVGQVYLDSESEQPVWVSVKSGLFGTSETLVPLSGADWDSSALHVAFSKDRVKDAPRVEPDAELSPEEQDRLYDYYGLAGGAADGSGNAGGTGTTQDRTVDDAGRGSTIDDSTRTDSTRTDSGIADTAAASGAAGAGYGSADADRDRFGAADGSDRGFDADGTATDTEQGVTYTDARSDRDATADTANAGAAADTIGTGARGHDTSGPNTDDAMTRSEERLNVGTEQVATGRARLRKYVVTEQQSVTVPVTHEEVRVEREPITDANRDSALNGADLSDEEHEVTLTEERPVVNKETVPVERVRLGTEQVTENQQVTEDVRHEEIETDGGADAGTVGRHDARNGDVQEAERTDR